MVVLYSLTCPVGIAIGIGVSDSYDPESTQAIATQVRCIPFLHGARSVSPPSASPTAAKR